MRRLRGAPGHGTRVGTGLGLRPWRRTWIWARVPALLRLGTGVRTRLRLRTRRWTGVAARLRRLSRRHAGLCAGRLRTGLRTERRTGLGPGRTGIGPRGGIPALLRLRTGVGTLLRLGTGVGTLLRLGTRR
ncbi:hypothetical protein ACFYYP_19020 [Microbispora rosea]|uniref:hypothetical protein n=1 Tax=Microbispora rosea TaxID=58117 RepID=UPI001A397A42|nr:hypothetical protein Mro03_22640 [Microbispora rosea subsp. rosea]